MRWPQPLRTLAGTLPGGTWTFQSWMGAIAVAAGYPEQSADLLAAGARQQPGSFDADPGADARGPDTVRAEPRKTGSLRSSGHPKACAMSLRTRVVLATAVLNGGPVSAICRGSSGAAILTGPRLQVTGEPVPGQPGDLLKRPWFLEQVRGTWNDLQPRLTAQLLHRLAVELDDHRVESPDDEQGRLGYRAQVLAGEGGAAAAGDDRRHRAGPPGRRDNRRPGAGAAAEAPDRHARGGAGRNLKGRPGKVNGFLGGMANSPASARPGSHRERIGLRDLALLPSCGPLQRLDRPGLIDVDHRVELVGRPGPEVVALPLSLGPGDAADRPLQARPAHPLRGRHRAVE